jgi:SAM-dependent methyltransferase
MSEVHSAAERGFTRAVQAYQRGRPEYPEQLQGWLRTAIGLHEGTTAVDLGAGTGKFTRVLRATGADIIAVEPLCGMLLELRTRMPEVLALAATAQKVALKSGIADAVSCAQAFHWYANRAALAEIHRILKPGGQLVLLWNARDESVDWVAALSEIMRPYEQGVPRFHSGQWRDAFRDAPFSPLQETRFAHTHVGSPETVIVDRVLSVSFIAALPDRERQAVAARLRALIGAHAALAGCERVAFPYVLHAYRCTRAAP